MIHDDTVVASVNQHKLYKAQLDEFVKDGLSVEDSTRMADAFILTWATDMLYLDEAEKQLSKSELDVTEELSDYRRSILKYRFEQRYVDDRLDTLITDGQIKDYYDSHKDLFKLARPILKVRFISIMKDAPGCASILKKLSSDKDADVAYLDTAAFRLALKYFNRTDTWMDARELAREFGVEYSDMLSRLKNSRISYSDDGRGDLREAYVADIIRSGIAPVEFCSEQIRDIILNARKRELIAGLEQDLLADARENNRFVIYNK